MPSGWAPVSVRLCTEKWENLLCSEEGGVLEFMFSLHKHHVFTKRLTWQQVFLSQENVQKGIFSFVCWRKIRKAPPKTVKSHSRNCWLCATKLTMSSLLPGDWKLWCHGWNWGTNKRQGRRRGSWRGSVCSVRIRRSTGNFSFFPLWYEDFTCAKHVKQKPTALPIVPQDGKTDCRVVLFFFWMHFLWHHGDMKPR